MKSRASCHFMLWLVSHSAEDRGYKEQVLREQTRYRMNPRNKERDSLLMLLSRSTREYYECHECEHIHHSKDLYHPILALFGGSKRWPGHRHFRQFCRGKDPFSVCISSKYSLHFTHLYLAMKEHRLGKGFGIPLEILASSEVESIKAEGLTRRQSFEARVCSDELLFRSQCFWCVKESLDSKKSCILLQNELGKQRPLSSIKNGQSTGDLGEALEALIKDSRSSGSVAKKRFTGNFLHLDFEIGVYPFTKEKLVLYMTKWLNLGGCHSPDDPIWRAHTSTPITDNKITTLERRDTGDISTRFEEGSGESHQKLTERNFKKLFSRRQRLRVQVMTKLGLGLSYQYFD